MSDIGPAEAGGSADASGQSRSNSQTRREGRFAARETGDASGKAWSPRRTIAFVVLVCSAFWIAVIASLVYFMG